MNEKKKKKVIKFNGIDSVPAHTSLRHVFPFLSLLEVVSLWTANKDAYNNNQYIQYVRKRLTDQQNKEINLKALIQKMEFKEELIQCLSLMYYNIPSDQHNSIFDQYLFHNFNITPLILFCTKQYSDLIIVAKMLKHKELQLVPDRSFLDPLVVASDTSEFVNQWIWEHQTPLYQAIYGCEYNIVALLLENGARIDNDSLGEKIIKYAIEKRGKPFAKTLLQNSPQSTRLLFIKRFKLFV